MTTPYGSPQAPQSAPAPQYYGAPVEDPGKTLGIVGFILAFLFAPVGIVLSAIGKKKSREAGFDNQLAKWGLILSIVFTAIWVVYVVFVVIVAVAAVSTGSVSSY
ncbi:DUF4190 domain-containing protein [Oerskovia paurometabola]|uniref:DUF4190 domain-containing protein n=1 Tax=Oerskovia paurometabola TaxID=162170 RepID=UPI003820F210